MSNQLLQLFGGYMKGMAENKQRDEKKEGDALKKQLINLQIQREKTGQLKETRINDIFAKIFEPDPVQSGQPTGDTTVPGDQKPTPMSSRLQENAGLIDKLVAIDPSYAPLASLVERRRATKLSDADRDASRAQSADQFKERLDFDKEKQAFAERKFESGLGDVDWRKETVEGVEYEVPYLKSGVRAPMPKREIGKTEGQSKIEEGQKDLSFNLDAMANLYLKLDQIGGMINLDNSSTENLLAALRSSKIGQKAGKMFGTDAQSLRNSIETIRPALINAIRQASNMGARGLDSERELDFYLKMTTETGMDIQADLAAIVILDETLGSGKMARKIRQTAKPNLLTRINDLKSQEAAVKAAVQADRDASIPPGVKIKRIK